MSEKKIVYDQSLGMSFMLRMIERGETLICPTCGAVLVVAIDDEVVHKLNAPHGLFCPNDHKHVSVRIDMSPPPGYWDKFKY